jgi:hypothetical protein
MRRTYSTYKHMLERVKKLGLPAPDFDLAELRGQVGKWLGVPCWYCLEKITPKTFAVDHSLPLSRGGSALLDNVQVICSSCNRAKGSMTGPEFGLLYSMMREHFPDEIRRDVIGRLKAGSAVRRMVLVKRVG